MNVNFGSSLRDRLEKAIKAICPIIEKRVSVNNIAPWSEYLLRKELVACILGSQVRHEMAMNALSNIEACGLLEDACWLGDRPTFENQIYKTLSGKSTNLKFNMSYRFPKLRAKQLAKTRDELADHPLTKRLSDKDCPKRLRKRLVQEISGLGPKQASMFLRNIGKSYDLAIIDTHVIRYMSLKNLLPKINKNMGSIREYERTERIVVKYAKDLGYPVGYIDWAVWATMKAARELGI